MKIDQVRRHALSLPDSSEAPHFHYSSFRVEGRIFVTVPPDEAHIHVFVDEDQREQALALDPGFLEKLFWGGKAVGLRVTLADADEAVVEELVRKAWEHRSRPARRRAKKP